MIVPGYEFLSAHFCNNERTIVKSWWRSPDGKDTVFEHIEAKDGDPNWENLLTHIDIDTLHEETYQQIKAQNEAFKYDVAKVAERRKLIYNLANLNEMADMDSIKLVTDFLFGTSADKEKLFMFKLKLFELDAIKNSNKKALKAKIRRSKSMLDIIKAAVKILDVKEAKVNFEIF